MIYVCPLSKVDATVTSTGADRLITLLSAEATMTRPAEIPEQNHLWLFMHDILGEREGKVAPRETHVLSLLNFANGWDRARPLVIHCYAGISRSTASAYILAAAIAPKRDEFELAKTLRGLSPTATPNMRLISLADAVLGRGGRMIEAVASIGPGTRAAEGEPFCLQIGR